MKMKFFLALMFLFTGVKAQNIGINTDGSTPDTKALLDIKGSGSGLLIPRMAWSSRPSGLTATQNGLIIYSTDGDGTNGAGFYYYNNPNWLPLFDNNKGWSLKGNAGITPPASPTTYGTSTFGASENFLGTTDGQPLTFGTNNRERMRILSSGLIGVGTSTPAMLIDVSGSTTINNDAVLRVTATGTTGSVNSIIGTSASTSGTGVYGRTTAASGSNNGVVGEITAGTGNGVKGVAGTASGNSSTGVWGLNNSTTTGAIEAFGVLGTSKGAGATSATHYGLFGDAAGAAYNIGVYAKGTGAASNNNYGGSFYASGATGYNAGVRSETNHIDGDGVFGYNSAAANTGIGSGVYGSSNQSLGAGVWGDGGTNSAGVFGTSAKSHVWNSGVYGENDNNTSGSSWTYTQVTCGISGRVTGTAVYATGVYGYNNNSTIDNNAAVFGQDGQGAFGGIAMTFTPSTTQRTMSIYGRGAGVTVDDRTIQGEWSSATTSPFGSLGLKDDGVWGINNGTTSGTSYIATTNGVYGSLGGSGNYRFGVYGYNGTTSNRTGGVMGSLSSTVWASNGYQSSTGSLFGLYSTATAYNGTTNTNGGKLGETQSKTGIGIGSYGDLMGLWTKGEVIGQVVDGAVSTLSLSDEVSYGDRIQILESNSGKENEVAYTTLSKDRIIIEVGKSKLINGVGEISLSDKVLKLDNINGDPIIQITPMGNCEGIFVDEFSKNKVIVKELRGGKSDVYFSYYITFQLKDENNNTLIEELKSKNFTENIKQVMTNESDPSQESKAIEFSSNKFIFSKKSDASSFFLKEKEERLKLNKK